MFFVSARGCTDIQNFYCGVCACGSDRGCFICHIQGVSKKKATLNILEYSLCFIEEMTFGPWDLKRIVIVFYRHNYLNTGCIKKKLTLSNSN